MSILHVRNIPEQLYERIKARAETQRRSLSAEVIALLESAIEEAERDPAITLQIIRERREQYPISPDAPDSTLLLREDRER
ncbi:MAG TPA: Arc family DNA-binding protein [Anaerolineae bacterium]|nr:Arc family DNA-binding protein [Anaerolineae bacterium]HQK14334.1 Arc family DNA-binding protein [Anaerolineae bacterium]